MQLFEVIPQGMGLILVMEYLPLSLYDMLHDVEYLLNEAEVKCYVRMILLGVKYMHENCIMHRVRTYSFKTTYEKLTYKFP